MTLVVLHSFALVNVYEALRTCRVVFRLKHLVLCESQVTHAIMPGCPQA